MYISIRQTFTTINKDGFGRLASLHVRWEGAVEKKTKQTCRLLDTHTKCNPALADSRSFAMSKPSCFTVTVMY